MASQNTYSHQPHLNNLYSLYATWIWGTRLQALCRVSSSSHQKPPSPPFASSLCQQGIWYLAGRAYVVIAWILFLQLSLLFRTCLIL